MNNLIELHCHFDGSLDLETTWELARERGFVPDGEPLDVFRHRVEVDDSCRSLVEYLERFDMTSRVLQDPEGIRKSMLAVIRNLNEDGLAYCELRFAPQLHTAGGLSQEQVLRTAIDAVHEAAGKYPEVHIRLILCMMTSDPESATHQANLETVQLAAKYLGDVVCAADLAGAEFPPIWWKPLFAEAARLHVPYTIHAGESGPAEDVAQAISMGALRIGHGGRCIEDPAVEKDVIARQIPLEQCITSTVQTTSQPSFEGHCLRRLFDDGAYVTLSTDDRLMSRTNLHREIERAKKYMGFTDAEILRMMRNAAEAVFADEAEKVRLRGLLGK